MHILHVVGARPNFMKAAPVRRALAACGSIRQTLVHTGQHYDFKMSGAFFQDLELAEPDVNLEVGSGTHAQQTAAIMVALEPIISNAKPDLVLVYGDVNSTLAAALVCSKICTPFGHVEAGLRSFDRTMPEEINRIVTDRLADMLFTPSSDGDENLRREGVGMEKIHLVGNVMIDSFAFLLPKALERWRNQDSAFGFERFGVVTLHRPSNVDDPTMLNLLVSTLNEISQELPLIFPLHPRTRQRLAGLVEGSHHNLRLIDPVGYLEFVALQYHATLVITDSGGIQEETTFTGVPCLTMRDSTERPVTVAMGTNTLVGRDMRRLRMEISNILRGKNKKGRVPPLWDGHASERIATLIVGKSVSTDEAAQWASNTA
jgi:UDP-N-acetylglucosamine 2-epimerase (non-hydrolysing)